MSNEIMRREAEEAVEAGERALRSLRAAREKLNSARSWGIVDLLGGGFVTDWIKHSRISEAAACMETARRDMQIFARELQDVRIAVDLKMEIGTFLSFADFFFDGVIMDYLVQSRIADAREQVADAIVQVEGLLQDLRHY